MSQQILPFYLLCDESGSMAGGPVNAINGSLRQLRLEIGGNSVVARKARFCLISFSNVAEVLLPLSDLSVVGALPPLTAQGGTDYEVAFRTLRRSVEALREFGQSLIQSLVHSGTRSATDPSRGAAFVVPDWVPGFTTISTDVVSG